ncbi:MAG: cell surface protein SprA [Owenweeksia sp.]
MRKDTLKTFVFLAFIAAVFTLSAFTGGHRIIRVADDPWEQMVADSTEPDSTLPYPFDSEEGGLYLDNPANYKEEVDYDPETGQYIVTQKIGNLEARPPMFMTPEEYRQYVARKQADDYWKSKTQSEAAARAEGRDPGSSLIPQIQVNNETFARIFGSNTIDIRPQGYAQLSFGGRIQNIDNPLIPERNRSTFNFDFDQRIQMNVTGKIGEKLQITTNYDTEATFSFENQMKVEFTGDEDDIIKKIEMGNVSLPLNSSLISGAQSLFGVKGQFQFGKLRLTGVFSEQRSQSSSINVQGGATTTDFEINGDQYEANKHYFLAQYFRDNYERFLSQMPLITSPVQITKVEVWVTNTRSETENTRNIVAFMDLGERDGPGAYRSTSANRPGYDIFGRFFPNRGFPDNRNNALNPEVLEQNLGGVRDISQVNQVLNSAGFEEALEYTELANARKLRPTEFTYDPQLGYISLSSALNQDEVLAVSFQFTAGGKTFQVGEFSTDGVSPPRNLVVKMLKSTILNVNAPMWDLMMKNIYSLNAFQVNREDFRLDILYRDDETGTPIPFLPDGNLSDQLLLRVMELDRLNNNNDPQPDGFFDYVPGITINTQTGRIIFPILEPFGSNLSEKLDTEEAREKYVFQQLYDSTRFKAQNETQLNKYVLKGTFKSSSSSEISLNAFNIPQGSVTVSAGGTQLVENVDYTVDYNLGRVRIINDGILNSGIPIKVDFENNSLFNFQTKTFMGLNAEYEVNQNLNVGATILRLSERPLTQKTNIGDEPISNSIFGFNGTYSKETPFLTRAVDAIPFIETKAKSNVTVQGEYAQLVPGSPRGIEIGGEPTTYLDDFESSQTTIDIRNPRAWQLASVPGGQPDLFPEYNSNDVSYGFNRAKLAWYTVDPLFHGSDSRTPNLFKENPELQSEQYTRAVYIEEVFPKLEFDKSQAPNIAVLDLAFYPEEKGPYNYDVEPSEVSAGIKEDGKLEDPSSRWGGIMRDLSSTNFEEQNIEFIQFWMLDPFLEEGATDGGTLYFNLGSVSEDILKDGKQAIENGKPADGDLSKLDSTLWGYAPRARPPVIAFDNDPASRSIQDVGYDMLNDGEEATYPINSAGETYLDKLEQFFGGQNLTYNVIKSDPSNDNFQYYRDPAFDQSDIRERYKNFNNPDGNSDPTTIDGVSAFATNNPDIEDINGDQTLSKTETYYQYKVEIDPNGLELGKHPYITDIRDANSHELPDNKKVLKSRWIQFKIPIFEPDNKVGPISDFRSIRFIRMYMKGFNSPIILRFARLELIRGEWRRYRFNLDEFGDGLEEDEDDQTLFEVGAVNVEQNASREPVPYVLPPGIDRQVLFGTASSQQQNEQSLSLRVCDLKDGAARAVFRNLDFDMRMYNRLKMFAHAEALENESLGFTGDALRAGDLNLFIRMGSDYNQNYYEYEIPLIPTPFGTTEEDVIWPAENEMDFSLSELKEVKLERDREYRTSGVSITEKYKVRRGKADVSVVGAPNLGNVRTIMIGVRNPKGRDVDNINPVCAEVWVNELRLTEFDQRGGWAANARVAAQLADFANVSISGRTSSVGFGSIDQSVNERQKEEIYAYDLQSSFQLGMFFPKDAGLRIPMYFGVSEEWKNPQFNPLDPDIEFDDALNNLETEEERQELREIAQDYTRRKSINFTNVRKERTGKKAQKTPQVYDVENFSASYSFNEVFRRNVNTKTDIRRDYTGSLNYTYQIQPKPVEPFKKVKFLQSDYLALVRDFNFYWYPRNFTAIGTMNRSYNILQARNIDLGSDIQLPVTYNKSFTFNRQYSLLYDITKALKVDFNARMNTRIDELEGRPDSTENKELIWRNLADFGRPTNYHQTLNVNWQVPVNKLPYFEFANVSARYTGDYDWAANSLRAQEGPDSLNYGNTVQNSMQIQLNNTFNLVALYNKFPYLRRVNQGAKKRPNPRRSALREAGRSRTENSPKEEEEEEERTTLQKILDGTVKTMMMVKNASANFSKTEGTLLPGFKPQASILGMDDTRGYAPGYLFTLGDQADIRQQAVDNDWLVTTPYLNNQYTRTYNETMNFRVTAEPANDLRIVLTANKSESSNTSEFFRFNPDREGGAGFESQNSFTTQNYTISYYTLPTAFESGKAPNYDSEAYTTFLANREVVSRQLAVQYANSGNAPDGYSPVLRDVPLDSSSYGYQNYSYVSQQVLIPAFLAAYSGKDINGFGTNPKRSIPIPNWQLTYDGLSKLNFIKKFFSSMVLSHSYRSTYTLNNISTNLLRQQKLEEYPDRAPLDQNGDLLPETQIGAVVLSEQFAPFIGFNMKLKNSMSIRLEYKKSRNLTLSLTNNQLTETKGTEWVVGTGYIIKDVRLKFISMGSRRTNPVSNLELKADIGIRDNVTIIRKILEDISQPTAGQKVITLKFSADYQLSKRVNSKIFYDLNLSRFKTSNAYPITTHQFGLSFRLNLGQ